MIVWERVRRDSKGNHGLASYCEAFDESNQITSTRSKNVNTHVRTENKKHVTSN